MSTDSTQGYSNNITSNSFAFALEPDSCAYPHDFGIDLCGVWQLGCYATEGNMDVDETYSFTGEAAISPDDEVGGCCHAVPPGILSALFCVRRHSRDLRTPLDTLSSPLFQGTGEFDHFYTTYKPGSDCSTEDILLSVVESGFWSDMGNDTIGPLIPVR